MPLIIEGELTDFNRYLNANRSNRFSGAKIKKTEDARVFFACKNQRIKPVEVYPVFISFRWYSKSAKIDVDNVAFSKKFILDGMVKAGVLVNDSRQYIAGFEDIFYIDKKVPRVEVYTIKSK